MRKLLTGSVLAILVIVLGLLGGYWHFSTLLPSTGSTGQAAAPSQAAPNDVPSEQARDVAATGPTEGAAPSFELLRVEPDGSTLLAGRSTPGSEIVIRDGDAVIAREQVGPSGDFALTLAEPLAVGDHELTLQATDADGKAASSAEVAVISVPPRGREAELLVALSAPNAATRLLAVPAPESGNAAPGSPPVEAAANAVATLSAVGDLPLREAAGQGPDRSVSQLAIAAVEIEGDRLYIAGSAPDGAGLRIYLNDEPVAEARSGGGDQFFAEASAAVPVGRHVVRADELDAAGSVVARVEVPFDRPAGERMSALAPEAAGAVPSEPVPAAKSSPTDVASAQVTQPEDLGLRTQSALEPVEGRVIIRRGDTLWRISRETYGLGRRFTVIYLANGDQIRDPDRIYPGQVFRLPENDDSSGADASAG